MSPVEISSPVSHQHSDEFVFTIPRYQRPYAWTTEQAGELLDDLLVSLNNGSGPVQELNPYSWAASS